MQLIKISDVPNCSLVSCVHCLKKHTATLFLRLWMDGWNFRHLLKFDLGGPQVARENVAIITWLEHGGCGIDIAHNVSDGRRQNRLLFLSSVNFGVNYPSARSWLAQRWYCDRGGVAKRWQARNAVMNCWDWWGQIHFLPKWLTGCRGGDRALLGDNVLQVSPDRWQRSKC